jgi:hypothetical protein
MNTSKKTIKVRAPKEIMNELRVKFPGVTDSNLIRMTYNTSLLKAEVKLEQMNFKDNFGKALYGNAWRKKQKR